MHIQRFAPVALLGGLIAALASLPASHATDPPSSPVLSLSREPAFNPAAPLLGRVQLKDDTGAVLHQWTSPQPNDLFGLSAIITPDVNGDGIADVAIAIPNAFDDIAATRVGLVVIKSGANGATLTTMSGTPLERFGLALFTNAGAAPGTSPTLTVLVEALDPNTNAPSGSFTFQSFDAFSGAFITEAVQAPSGFTAQAAEDSLAIYIRAGGPADLDASGAVTPNDLSILANNYGISVDPITGQLLEQNPTLAATPTGDTNGDGVVDAADLNNVLSNLGQQLDPNHVPIDESLTEAEALVVEAGFRQAVPMSAECRPCHGCPPERCLRRFNPFEELDGDPPDFDDGDDGTGPPDDDDGPGGGGGPGDEGPDPDGDDDGDGILNKDDCDSAAFAGGCGGGNCSDPCGDTDGDGTKDQDDCDSECHQNVATRAEVCECTVTIEGCPTPDGLPVNGVSPTEVIILPDVPAQGATVTLTATGDPGGGTYQWLVVGAVADHLDQPTITVTVTNPGEVVASLTYTTQDPTGQPCIARDRCEFLAWRCVIEPTQSVMCLTDPPEPTALTVDPINALDAEIRWTVVQGSDHVTPTLGSGTTFEVTPEEPCEVVVKCEFVRNGIPKCDSELSLTIPGPVCGTNTTVSPMYDIKDAMPPGCSGNWGETYVQDPPTVTTEVCIDSTAGGWVLSTLSVKSEIYTRACDRNRVDISSAMDPAVTSQTYCVILSDLTPIGIYLSGPKTTYTSVRCTKVHEDTHVAEWQQALNSVWTQYEPRFELGVASCAMFPHRADAEHYFELLTFGLADDLFRDAKQQWPDDPPGTSQAYPNQETCHSALRAGILQRAQAEGWPACPP